MKKTVEYKGQSCYIPTSGLLFIKCKNPFNVKDYTEEFSSFIRTGRNRSGVMTSARTQIFCRKYNINIVCFEGTRISPRNVTGRNVSLLTHNNPSCLIWKSTGVSFNQVIKDELYLNFNLLITFYLINKHVESFV